MTLSTAPTLMVVGDDASFRYLIERYAKKSACRVVFAHLTGDVLPAVLQEGPGIVMVELDASDQRGKDVLRELKAHPDTRQIPVIACSWTDETEWCLKEGAAIHMQKPILYDDFHAALMDVRGWQTQ